MRKMSRVRSRLGAQGYYDRRRRPSLRVLLRLCSYLPPLKWKLIGAGICTVIISLTGLGVGGSAKFFIDAIKGAAGTRDMTEVNRYALLALCVFLTRAVFTFCEQCLMSSVTQRLGMRLRNQVFGHLQAQSLSFFDRNKTGQLMSSITNDVPAVQNSFTNALMNTVSSPVTIVGGVMILLWLNWRLAAVSLICLPLIAWLLVRASRRMRRNAAVLQETLAEVSDVAEETLSGHRTVKAFGNEQYEIDRFETRSLTVFRTIMKNVRIRATTAPVIELAGAVAIVTVLWFGGREIVYGTQMFTIGGLTAFVFILKEIADATRSLGGISLSLSGTSAAAERIFALLDCPPEVQEKPGAFPLPPVRGRVTFESVDFAYRPGLPVLRDVSFAVEPGQVVALVGRSGAGKSTIAALIPRFYEVHEGAVKIDGIDVRDVTLQSLRDQIGIVPQDPHLFAGSVLENIGYGRLGASNEEIVAAAVAANAHDFIMQLPEGYDTRVGERGVRLSGGQRQRISIARAILRDPMVLILDEATSSLDMQSEALVQDALQRLVSERTTVVIAHRLSTIRHADTILVIDEGQVVERGTHEELLGENGTYAQLYRTQFRHEAELVPN